MSWPHIDASGFNTSLGVETEYKYWILGTPKTHMDKVGYYKDFDISGSNLHLFDWEGWLLRPADVL